VLLTVLVLPGLVLLLAMGWWFAGAPSTQGGERDTPQARVGTVVPTYDDAAPDAGHCVGWRRSVMGGDWERARTIEQCLRILALDDRAAAVADAKRLRAWDLPMDSAADLALLVATLAHFATDAEANGYLVQLGLADGAGLWPDEAEWRAEPALSVQDKLLRRGRLLAFDVETGFWPNRHDLLLAELAALAGPPLSNARFAEEAPPPDNPDGLPYRLSATLDGRDYAIEASDYSDWYDLAAVLQLLDRMAMEAGMPQRFVPLPTGDQTAQVLVAPADAIATAVRDGQLAITDADGALATGRAAEAAFRQRLRQPAAVAP
jgi:hypothetical protein